MLLSVIMTVYNEEWLLRESISSVIDYVDELIIIDGSEKGPSTDSTKTIIQEEMEKNPNKIKYFQGKYDLPEGGWDVAWQRNLALSQVNSQYVMVLDADELYRKEDMKRIREVVELETEAKLFYHTFIEFFYDTNHIRLGNGIRSMPKAADTLIYSMELEPRFEYHGDDSLTGGTPTIKSKEFIVNRDSIFIPQVIRYHYGWVRPFERQVERHVRNILSGAWGELGKSLVAQGKRAIYGWSVKHVLSYPEMNCFYKYIGEKPLDVDFCVMDGYDESLEDLESRFGESFWEDYSEKKE